MSSVLNEQTQFTDSGGNPIVNGLAYFGVAGSDPKISPITIFSDRDLTVVLPNPQTLDANGRTTNKVWLPGRYSIKIEDVNNVQLYQELDNGEAEGATITSLTNVLGTNAITADASPTITALVDKALFIFQIINENTADPITLAIDGTGAKSIKRNFDQDMGKGKFKVGQTVIVAWNSGKDYFEWTNENSRVVFRTEGASIPSAATIDLSSVTGNFIHITGNNGPIASFGTFALAGVDLILSFDGNPTVNNGANLIMPNASNRTMAAGDKMWVITEGSNVFRVLNIMPSDGRSLLFTSQAEAQAGIENTKTMTSLRVEEQIAAQVGTIDQTAIAAAAVGQGELKTATGTVQNTGTTATNLTLPGGKYGFYPEQKHGGPLSSSFTLGQGLTNTSFLLQINISNADPSGTGTAQQTFVQASPPYNMGDGDVFSFIFALIDNATGLIKAMYHAPDPPWANNGPTNIRPDRVDLKTGKQYKTIQSFGLDKALLMNLDFIGESEIEITPEFKNSDMLLIPHPFQGNDLTGKTVILIDPMSAIVERLEAVKNAGGDVSEFFTGGYVKLDLNNELNRGRPPGVMSVSIAMK